jgi:hypothetical protein
MGPAAMGKSKRRVRGDEGTEEAEEVLPPKKRKGKKRNGSGSYKMNSATHFKLISHITTNIYIFSNDLVITFVSSFSLVYLLPSPSYPISNPQAKKYPGIYPTHFSAQRIMPALI